jgi:hypothetical protein
MNIKELTEADIRSKYITPAIIGDGAKWDLMTQVREEIYFTKGRVIVRNKRVRRGEASKADYILFYRPNVPLAVIEAKDNNHSVGDGMQQPLPTRKLWTSPSPTAPTALPSLNTIERAPASSSSVRFRWTSSLLPPSCGIDTAAPKATPP